MFFRKMAATAALVMLATSGAWAQSISLQSVNIGGHFIRHQQSVAKLTPLASPLDFADATFVQRPGLTGAPGTISFEASNFPGTFLRHKNFQLILSPNDGTGQFAQDASFVVRTGLSDPNGRSFESVNFPGYFIRHKDFLVWVGQNEGNEQFARDATFLVQTVTAAVQPRPAPAPDPAPPPGGGANIVMVNGAVELYDAPGGEGKVIGELQQGQQIALIGCREDNWCQVSSGWVWGDYLNR